MVASIRDVASDCLGKTGVLSIREDILGVYGTDNPQNRSVLQQMDRIQNLPFVKVALVTIQGSNNANLQRDLDNASTIYQSECSAWVYCMGSITVNDPGLLVLNQCDCSGNDHSVSDEEDELFELGRNLGANIVCYYINGSNFGNVAGCAAHPPGRRGFWVNQNAGTPLSPVYSQWTFAHELTHVIGDNGHICDTDNLMLGNPCTISGTINITNPPPDLDNNQCDRILDDPDMESCS